MIVPTQIREISRGPLPKAVFLDYQSVARHENDCRFVIMQGIVRAALYSPSAQLAHSFSSWKSTDE